MSESINISMELLGNVLGTDPGVLVESLKAADGNLKPDTEIGQFLKDNFGKKFGDVRKSGLDEGYGRGKREVLTAKEQELAKKFEITEHQGFDSLIDAIVTKHSQSSKLNPDDVRKSEHYQADIKAKNDEIKKWKSELDGFKSQVEQEKVSSKVNSAIKGLIENPDNKYVIPQNQTIRENLYGALMAKVFSGGTKFDINGDAINVLDKDDHIVRDDLQSPMSFESFVHNHAKGFFEIAQGDGRQGTGAQTQPGSGGGSFVFKSQDDFVNQYQNEPDPLKRTAMKAQFETQVSKGAFK